MPRETETPAGSTPTAGQRAIAAPPAVLGAWGLVSFAAALRLFRWPQAGPRS